MDQILLLRYPIEELNDQVNTKHLFFLSNFFPKMCNDMLSIWSDILSTTSFSDSICSKFSSFVVTFLSNQSVGKKN